jgi:hypothetical protein
MPLTKNLCAIVHFPAVSLVFLDFFLGAKMASSSTVTKLSTPLTFKARGGSVAISVSRPSDTADSVLVYGGADREGNHFNDVLLLSPGSDGTYNQEHLPVTKQKPAALPALAGANGVALSDLEILLFGGINFVEETVSNDLLTARLLVEGEKTTGIEWAKAKQSGEKPAGRTGHVIAPIPLHLAIAAEAIVEEAKGLALPHTQAFILFGGSSPYSGAMNDLLALVAVRKPGDEKGGVGAYHFHWEALPTKGKAPAQREMHTGFVRPPMGASSEYAPAIQTAVRNALEKSGFVALPTGLPWDKITASSLAPAPATGSGATCAPYLVVAGGRNDEGAAQRDTCVLDLSSLVWHDPVPLPHAVISSASGTVTSMVVLA